MTGPESKCKFCFPRISISPETKSRETLRFEGNKIHCARKDQSLSDLSYSKTKANFEEHAEIRVETSGHLWSCATVINISRVTVCCFPFDFIVFAMLPSHGIWWKTVSFVDVMWPWKNQWMDALYQEKRQLYNNRDCYIPAVTQQLNI